MDSRNLLAVEDQLNILIDSSTIDDQLSEGESNSRKILRYQQNDQFSFLRTPDSVSHAILNAIEEYSIERESGIHDSLRWTDHWEALRYTEDDLERTKSNLESIDIDFSLEELQILGVQANRNEGMTGEDKGILLTSNRNILSNRRALESEFGVRLNITTPSELAEFLGLFMRFWDNFRYYPDYDENMSYGFDLPRWCWSLRELCIPHARVGDEYLASLKTRFENLILGLDEIGYQYYQGTGNHTNIRTRYHFDHIISLFTGIFDSLALHTRDKFNIELQDRNTSIRTGEPLFQELREENQELWEYIHRNHPFVELIYVIRPLVIHREGVMLTGPGFSYCEGDNYTEWQTHVMEMDGLGENDRENFRNYYRQLDDIPLNYDPMTEWGLITGEESIDQERLAETVSFIEPYQFVKRSTKELVSFVDGFLQTLDYDNRLDMLSEEYPERYAHLRSVEEYMLSPLL